MKTEEEILNDLRSKNPETVIQIIEELRVTGRPSNFSVLLDLLHETTDNSIKIKILNLFSELKSVETIPLMMAAITNERYASEQSELLSCCWQNGLDYSGYLTVFVDIVINKEFSTAFEAFTVIENLTGKINEQIIRNELIKIKDAVDKADEQKKYLLISLPEIIRNIPEDKFSG